MLSDEEYLYDSLGDFLPLFKSITKTIASTNNFMPRKYSLFAINHIEVDNFEKQRM